MTMKDARECRYQMRFWLEASKDAKMRGDRVNEQHAIEKFRENRDALLAIWASESTAIRHCG